MSASAKNPISAKAEMASYLFKEKFRKVNRKKLRKRLTNDNFTIICNNCNAGIIYYNLGKQFLSPTINLSISPDEYCTFLENLDEALSAKVEQTFDTDKDYPVGVIRLSSGKTIHLYFMHYQTFDEALQKWNVRRERVNKDNLFVLMELGKMTSEETLERFFALPYEHQFALVDREMPHYPNTQYLDFYDKYKKGNNTIMDYRNGLRFYKRYLDDFDYVQWLNNGKDNQS